MALPLVIDSILDYLQSRGVTGETLDSWDTISLFATEPEEAARLARDLGLIRG